MVKINVKELKKFINAAGNIKSSSLLPIYSCVKIVCDGDCATFYKSNGHSFVACPVSAEFKTNDTFIIEEKVLFGFVKYLEGGVLIIKQDETTVVLSDDAKESKVSRIEDVFPIIQEKGDSKDAQLDTEVITALYLSKDCTLEQSVKDMRTFSSYCNITRIGKKSYIVGLNGHISYFKSFKKQLPEMNLEPDIVSVISKYNLVSHCSSGNYNVFTCDNVIYGFIKAEVKMPDLTDYISKFKSNEYLVVDRNKVLKFCEMVIDTNTSNIPPEVTIKDSGKKEITLDHWDITNTYNANEKVKVVEKNFKMNPFTFQPRLMITLLKNLSVENIKMSYVANNFIISSSEDADYFSSIAELATLSTDNVMKKRETVSNE